MPNTEGDEKVTYNRGCRLGNGRDASDLGTDQLLVWNYDREQHCHWLGTTLLSHGLIG